MQSEFPLVLFVVSCGDELKAAEADSSPNNEIPLLPTNKWNILIRQVRDVEKEITNHTFWFFSK